MNPTRPAPTRVSGSSRPWPLHDAAGVRALESQAQAGLPPHMLMQRAGEAVARLALALAPHARRVAVWAGPGNNGGDGFEAAWRLQRAGLHVQVVALGDPARLPADAAASLRAAQAAGVAITPGLPTEAPTADLAIDALLGLGLARAPAGPLAQAIALLNRAAAPVLAVDLPSGLHAATGTVVGEQAVRARHTLSLLALKPGLFTASGRDHAGEVWFDPLGVSPDAVPAVARLAGVPPPAPRLHAQHKGSFGDVLVIGGAPGMTGAAWLAGRAALAAGAGRVHLRLLDAAAPTLDPAWPELMARHAEPLDPALVAACTVVCGCGGGDRLRGALALALARAPRLLLDADALNTLAADPGLQAQLAARAARGAGTLLTPHPLEAARLLGCDTAAVQADRLGQAQALAERFGCAVLLKGSGSVIAAPGAQALLNPTGNALLASAGTGDVLAGWTGGLWSQQAGAPAFDAAWHGAYRHGQAADDAAAEGQTAPLRAAALVQRLAGDRT